MSVFAIGYLPTYSLLEWPDRNSMWVSSLWKLEGYRFDLLKIQDFFFHNHKMKQKLAMKFLDPKPLQHCPQNLRLEIGYVKQCKL